MIKIPGTAEGVPAIEQAIAEGINVNVTLLFSRRGLREGRRGLHPRPRAPPRRGQAARRALGRVVLRLARGHRGRQAPRRRPPRAARHRGHRQRPRRLPALQGDLRRRALGRAAPRPARACSARCGPRPARRTRPIPRRMYVDELVGPNTVNTMPMATLLAAAEHARGRPGRPPTRTRPRTSQRSPSAGIDMDDVTDVLLRRRHRRVRGRDGRAPGRRRAAARSRRARRARRRSRPTSPPSSSRRSPQRVEARAARSVAQRIWRKDETLWGGPRQARDRRPARLADDRRAACSSTLDDLLAFAEELRDDGLHRRRAAGHGRLVAGPGGPAAVVRRHRRRAAPARARLHRPRRGAARGARDRPRQDAVPRLVEVGRRRSSRSRTSATSRSQRPDGAPLRRRHRPGLVAGATSAQRRVPPRVRQRPRHRRALLARCRTSASCPRRSWASPSTRCCTARQVAEQACTAFDAGASNAGLWLGLAMGELARAGRDKLTFVVYRADRDASGCGSSSWSPSRTGKQGKGSCRSPTSRSATPDAYGDDRVFAYLRNADEPDADARREGRGAGRRRPPDGHAVGARPARPGPDLLLRRVRDRGGRLGARHQPVRPAQRAGGQGQHRQGAALRRAGSCPSVAEADDDALRALLARPAPPHYVAMLGLPPAASGLRRAPWPSCATRSAARTARGDHVRLRAALPALDRPVPQGRPADRRVPAARARRRRRRGRPRRGLHFGTLKRRAGRPATCRRCATTACRPSACGWRATRPRRSTR